MKTFYNKLVAIVLLAGLFSVSAIGQETKDHVESNLEKYEMIWDQIVNQGKIDLINEENFDENITMVLSPENIVGIEAFKDYYQNYLTGFSDITFAINQAFGYGDNLVKHWTFTGTHSGDFFGIPATGRMVNVEGVTLAIMKNGKITQEQDFIDNMSFFQQLGILSNPNNVNIVEGLYKAFATGDIPAALAPMAPNIVWNEAESFPYSDMNPYEGPEAVLNGVFARIGAEWEYWNLTDIELHEMSNNQVLATLRYDAKYKKNGAIIDSQTAHLWTLKDGKIIEFQQFTDTKQVTDAVAK